MLQRFVGMVADRLWAAGAFRDRTKSEGGLGFRLALHDREPNAPLSPFYLSIRVPSNKGTLSYGDMAFIGSVLWDHLQSVPFNLRHRPFRRVVGLPNAGEPIAECLVAAASFGGSRDMPEPSLIRLKKSVEEGKRALGEVNGEFDRQDWTLVVDDLITSADVKILGVEALEAAGLRVRDALVLVDREQGGRQELERRKNIRLTALMTITQLVEYYHARHFMPDDVYRESMAYVEENRVA